MYWVVLGFTGFYLTLMGFMVVFPSFDDNKKRNGTDGPKKKRQKNWEDTDGRSGGSHSQMPPFLHMLMGGEAVGWQSGPYWQLGPKKPATHAQ